MGRIDMGQRELVRYRVLSLVLEGQLALQDAAAKLVLSERQTRRLLNRVTERDAAGLVHGNRGRAPSNRTAAELREKILAWVADGGPYSGLNDTHLQELLAEREGVKIGRETLRALLREAGFRAKRRRRPRHHHRRRERSPVKGLMVLWDGSPHRWLGPEQPELTLMAALDDADSELLGAFLTTQETSEAYLRLLQVICKRRGLPASIYQDRHGALRRNDDSWSLEEELAGRQRPTQVGQALEDLGIRPIFALSPQAKGRIERLFATLQDRLLAELRLAQVSGVEEANRFLEETWIDRCNQRFQKNAAKPGSAYRPIGRIDLHRILAFRYPATVLNDNTVHLGGQILDIPPGPRRRSYAKAAVDVRQHLDGSWTVYYQDAVIAHAAPSLIAEPLRYKTHRSKRRTKAARHDYLVYRPEPPNQGTLSLGS
jgi:transposase InsO family protein